MIDNEDNLLSIEQDLLDELEQYTGKIPQVTKIIDGSSGVIIVNSQITEFTN